jgi:L-serine dehydratase
MHLFDVIGPVMIGPSSSHTAGAARIGRVVRRLLGAQPVQADIGFHGSFATTFKGHGTDRAVAGGLMDFDVDDARLRDSLTLAREAGLVLRFSPIQLRNAHPNTIVIDARAADGRRINVQAASIGGGSIRIESMNGLEVGFSGTENTIVIQHRDAPGVIARVSGLIAERQMNIATMQVFRKHLGAEAVMVLEVDGKPPRELLDALQALPGITSIAFLEKR